MADEEHLKIIKLGSEAWNNWRRANPDLEPDLTGASLSGRQLGNLRLAKTDLSLSTLKKTNLRGSDFWCTDLNLSDMSGSVISRSLFGRAHINTANLSHSEITDSRFVGSDLGNANLTYAKIFQTSFIDCDLNGTDFGHAWLKESAFSSVDLSLARGLETVRFIGPSSLGIDSIYKSKGMIPVSFMRGCGVPEEFIELIPSLQFNSPRLATCFICHNTLDRIFCDQLHADLQRYGVRCWFMPDDFSTSHGKKILAEFDSSRAYDRLLVVCSKHSLQTTPIIAEMEYALKLGTDEQRNILLCVTRDDYMSAEWTHPLKDEFLKTVVSDFRHWERPDSYERALGKVLKALKIKD